MAPFSRPHTATPALVHPVLSARSSSPTLSFPLFISDTSILFSPAFLHPLCYTNSASPVPVHPPLVFVQLDALTGEALSLSHTTR
jgi:hypothetical protein